MAADHDYKTGRLRQKYVVTKSSGEPVDPEAQYFVLRVDADPHARVALLAYINSVVDDNAAFAIDLHNWLRSLTPTKSAGPSVPHTKPKERSDDPDESRAEVREALRLAEEALTDVAGIFADQWVANALAAVRCALASVKAVKPAERAGVEFPGRVAVPGMPSAVEALEWFTRNARSGNGAETGAPAEAPAQSEVAGNENESPARVALVDADSPAPDVEALLDRALRDADWIRLSYDARKPAHYEVSLSYPGLCDGVGPTIADALRAALDLSGEKL